MVAVTPFFFCISAAYVFGLFKVMIPAVINSDSFLILCEKLVITIASLLILLVALFMAIIPAKEFLNMAWLSSGRLIFAKDAIEIHGKSRKVFIPLKSIQYLLKTKRSTILLIWKTQKGINRFFIRANWVGENSFSQIIGILRNNGRYIEDPHEMIKIWNQLKLSNITLSGLFKRGYDLSDGTTD